MLRPAAVLTGASAAAGALVVATTALAPTRCSGLLNIDELAAVVRSTEFTMAEVVRLKNK